MRESNSVFISYRRSASGFLALAVYQDLTANGIDAFYDIENIDAGQFDAVILNQIAARPYFMITLTPGTLKRCAEAGDWLRKEIKHALSLKRVIVPLHTPEFNFGDIDEYLPAAMAAELKRFNAVEIPLRYFKYAMTDVRTRFLKPIALETTPAPASDAAAVARKIAKAKAKPPVTEKQLSAHEYFERGGVRYNKGDMDGAIADNSKAIRLNPKYAEAYYNRGAARKAKGDLDGAIADYDEAIRLNPEFAAAYNNRGNARSAKGDYDGACIDFTEAIRLNPEYIAYSNRGLARQVKGDLNGAIADYDEAIRLNSKYAEAYCVRGLARQAKGDLDGAIADYSEAIHLDPEYAEAYNNRALARADKKDYAGAVADGQKALDLGGSKFSVEEIRNNLAEWRKQIQG